MKSLKINFFNLKERKCHHGGTLYNNCLNVKPQLYLLQSICTPWTYICEKTDVHVTKTFLFVGGGGIVESEVG